MLFPCYFRCSPRHHNGINGAICHNFRFCLGYVHDHKASHVSLTGRVTPLNRNRHWAERSIAQHNTECPTL